MSTPISVKSGSVKKVCATCCGTNVRKDADVMWDESTQEWEVAGIYDNETCDDCGGDTTIIDAPSYMRPIEALPLHLEILLLHTAQTAGTLDPDVFLPFIEERLTQPEFDSMHAFLKWLTDNGLHFGHGNIQRRFAEFQHSLSS